MADDRSISHFVRVKTGGGQGPEKRGVCDERTRQVLGTREKGGEDGEKPERGKGHSAIYRDGVSSKQKYLIDHIQGKAKENQVHL